MFQKWTPQSENSQHSIWQNRPLITKPFPHSEQQMEVLSVEMISCHYTLAQSWELQIPPEAAWISARAPLGTVSTASAKPAANMHVRNNTCCNAFNALLQILYSTKYWILHAFRHNMTSLSSLDTACARSSCLGVWWENHAEKADGFYSWMIQNKALCATQVPRYCILLKGSRDRKTKTKTVQKTSKWEEPLLAVILRFHGTFHKKRGTEAPQKEKHE